MGEKGEWQINKYVTPSHLERETYGVWKSHYRFYTHRLSWLLYHAIGADTGKIWTYMNFPVSRLCPMFPRFLLSLDRFYSEEFCFYSMVAIFCTGGWDIIFSILIYVEKSVTFHIKMYLRESGTKHGLRN